MQLPVVLGLVTLATAVHAQPADVPQPVEPGASGSPAEVDDDVPVLDTTSLSDDLIDAIGLRPIRATRLEALVSTGSFATHRAAARATTRRGAFGVELDGQMVASDGYAPVADVERGATDRPATLAQRDSGARFEYAGGASHARAFGRWSDVERGGGIAHQRADVRTARYGGRWSVSRDSAHLELELVGERQRTVDDRPLVAPDRGSAVLASRLTTPTSWHALRASLRPRRVRAGGLDHELLAGTGVLWAAGQSIERDLLQMHADGTERRIRGSYRVLDAYLEDTVRLIRSLDLSAGFSIEQWANLGGSTATVYGDGEEMAVETPDVSALLAGGTLGAVYRIDHRLALRARSSRRMRAPTSTELYRPVQSGDVLVTPDPGLRPETEWATAIGPELTAGRLTARAAVFYAVTDRAIGNVTLDDDTARLRTNIGQSRVAGIETEASWRPRTAWLATVSYAQASSRVADSAAFPELVGNELARAPRHRATARLTFDEPRIATLTGALRYVARSFADDRNMQPIGGYAVVDALAARALAGGLTGFVGIENLLDRRYLVDRGGVDLMGAPRMFHLGLRVDTARF